WLRSGLRLCGPAGPSSGRRKPPIGPGRPPMRSLPWLLLLLPQVPGQAARERPPLERPGLLELSLPERGGVRAEHFQLSLPGAPGEPVGASRLLRVEDQEE